MKSKKLYSLYVPDNKDVQKSNSLEDEYKNYRKFIQSEIKKSDNLKIYKYRHYLKVVKPEFDINEKDKILTFVLFNPSSANQYKLDATIANCAYLTFENKNYNGFEILNLINKRDPKTDLILKNWQNDNKICEYKDVIFKEVVLAWGKGNQKEEIIKHQWEKLNKCFKNPDTKYYKLYANIDDKSGFLHFGNSFWNSQKLPFKQSLKSGKISLKAVKV